MGKYGATRVRHAGFSFASKLESALYDALKEREELGQVKNIVCQSCVYLTEARILYKPDFEFFELDHTGQWLHRFAEAKGVETSSWRIKRKLWMFYGPAPLEIWKGSYQRLRLEEILSPK